MHKIKEITSCLPVNWAEFTKLIPTFDDESKTYLLFWVANQRRQSEDKTAFINQFLALDDLNFSACDQFGNSPFLWAVSRYVPEELLTKDDVMSGELGSSHELSATRHSNSEYLDKLFAIIAKKNPTLLSLASTQAPYANTPLIMAIKNGNTPLALKLIQLYSHEALLHTDNAGNSALHLASFFRMNDVVNAIIDKNDVTKYQKNAHGYTAADCYNAEIIPENELIIMLQYTQRITISTLVLYDKRQDREIEVGNDELGFFITASAAINFNHDQECAHPYSRLRERKFDESINDLLSQGTQLKPINYYSQNVLLLDNKKVTMFHTNPNSLDMLTDKDALNTIFEAFHASFPEEENFYILSSHYLVSTNQRIHKPPRTFLVLACIKPDSKDPKFYWYKVSEGIAELGGAPDYNDFTEEIKNDCSQIHIIIRQEKIQEETPDVSIALIMQLYEQQQELAKEHQSIGIILSIFSLVFPPLLLFWVYYLIVHKDDIVKYEAEDSEAKTYKNWERLSTQNADDNTKYDLYFFNENAKTNFAESAFDNASALEH